MERKMNRGLWPLFLGGLVSLLPFTTTNGNTGELTIRSVSVGVNSYDYQVFVPSKLADSRNAPVIVFLHGIGQRGSGGIVATDGPAGKIVRHYLEKVGAIIVLPQCRAGMYWSTPEMDQMVIKEVDDVKANFKVDTRRIYLTGVSMGGYGVWHLASQHPGRFAALVSVCGGSSLQTGDRFAPIAKMIGRTPVWIFHGEDDKVVPVTESRQMVAALRSFHGDVHYNEYPGVGHNVWMKVIEEKQLVPWLLKQRLP
jgi:predicted peptidase